MTNISDKQAKFHKIFFNYSRSIKSSFNISCVDAASWFDNNDRFRICDFPYNTCITKGLFSDWVRRHVFTDIFELTREIFFTTIVDLFPDDISFSTKKNSAKKEIKKRKNLNLDVAEILEILGINEKFSGFISAFTEYKRVRNSLTHRFGEVSHHDQPPLYLGFHTIDHGIQLGENISYFKTIEEANKIIAENPDQDGYHIVLKFNYHTKKYELGDRIIITNENIYGVSGYMYSNMQNIFRELFSQIIPDLEKIITKSDPFQMKYEIKLCKDNSVKLSRS